MCVPRIVHATHDGSVVVKDPDESGNGNRHMRQGR